MSVMLECLPGDVFFCLQDFYTSPEGQGFSWKTCRHFRVGERLRYVSSRHDTGYPNRPNSWLVVFDAADGKRYAATQTYFVTEECWRGLKKYFALSSRRTRPGTKPKTGLQQSAKRKKQTVASASRKRRIA